MCLFPSWAGLGVGTIFDIPPWSVPSTTFINRGRQWVLQCSPSSMPIHLRPILCATAAVVPEPRKESSTQSPSLVAKVNILYNIFSGFGVAKESPLNKSFDSYFAILLSSANSRGHHVSAVIPSFTSVKNFLTIGLPVPFTPNHIRLSFKSSLYLSSDTTQERVGGGKCF